MERESSILGVKVHPFTFEETIATIERFIEEREPRMVITLGTEMVMAAQKSSEFISVVNGCDLVCADAVGIVWALRRKGVPVSEKVAGIEILERLCSLSGRKGWRLYFLGAGESVAEEAVGNLKKRYPDMIVAGISHGFFKDDGEMIRKIREASPDVLFIALGSPKQEYWFREHRGELGVPVGIGVGGSLDVLSGKLKRSPKWMIRFGLEWLYRLYLQPWRWKRMLVLPLFVLQVVLRDRK
jgi:N-acetylglucosaminyldiphosphoundecaprenol N-acetyl-beta-D-mannosaminyltransferase